MQASRQRLTSRTALSTDGVRRPFWLPGPAYYCLSLIFSVTALLSVWGILQEGEEAFSIWLGAVAGASVFLGSVLVREVFLRNARDRYLTLRRQLDESVLGAKVHGGSARKAFKLSTRQNAEMVRRIRKKSDAARELGGISKGHFDVFELCGEYLVLNKDQIENANLGSPRLAELRKGRDYIERLRHFHLLAWAQIESTALTAAAAGYDTLEEKFQKAREALGILETALHYYPSDSALRDSELAVREFISSLQIKNWMEIAERQALSGDFQGAEATLRQALGFVDEVGSVIGERERVRERLLSEIQRLGSVQSES